MAGLCYRPKKQDFQPPLSQMLTDLDDIWHGPVFTRNTLVGSV